MIEPRVYRAAFLPALLCVVVAMFSLENRPSPAPQGLAADVLFEGRVAVQTLRNIERRHPDRRPGSPGNAAVADIVARELAQRRFGSVVRHRFSEGGERLVNVVATRPGSSRERIVVLAGRDTGRNADATGTAADTAALIELARVLEGRATRHTVVFASVDGNSLGYAGARRFIETAEDRDRIRAVVVLSNLAASTSRGALVVGWSNDATRANISLARTVASSLRQELGGVPLEEGTLGQLARLALPIGVGAQGPLLERGADAVRISGSGELPPERTGIDDIDVERFGELGRGALRALSALDGRSRLEHGPDSYVIASRKVLPGWALELLAAALILPALVASIDAFARASRRREGVGRFWAWTAATVLPFLLGLGLAELLVLAGAAPDYPAAALAPRAEPLDVAAVAVLGVVVAAIALAWMLLRPLAATLLAGSEPSSRGGQRRRRLDPSSPGAGAVVSLALAGAVTATWFANPFAALTLIPALHLWMLALTADLRRGVAAAFIAAGLVAPAGVVVYYLARLALDPLEGAWYAFLLVTGHHIGLPTAALWCVLAGILGATVAVVISRERAERDGPGESARRVHGPGGYAGPGSLGGTESALRR